MSRGADAGELDEITEAVTWAGRRHGACDVPVRRPQDRNPTNALYHYRENADQSGDFAFLTQDDINDNGSALETWHLRSRWLAGGSGRSDVAIVGGDLGEVEVTATECWDEMFARTYWLVTPELIEPAEGSPQSCVFDYAPPKK